MLCVPDNRQLWENEMGAKEILRPSLKQMMYIYCNGGKKHQVIYKTWRDLQPVIYYRRQCSAGLINRCALQTALSLSYHVFFHLLPYNIFYAL